MRMLRAGFSIVVLMLLGACDRASGPASVREGDVRQVVIRLTRQGAPVLVAGDTLRLVGDVQDAAGNPVDSGITWSSSNPYIAMVSSNGLVTARRHGQSSIRATAGGIVSQPLRVIVKRFDLGPDSVVLAGWGCGVALHPRGEISPPRLTYWVTNPGVLALFRRMTTGSYVERDAGLFGLQEGTTQVVASHESGEADTVHVRVLEGQAPRVRLEPKSSFTGPAGPQLIGLTVGDTLRAYPVVTACGTTLYGPGDLSWMGEAPAWPPMEVRNLAPEVLTASPWGRWGLTIVPRKAGTGLLVRPAGERADTFATEVFDARLLPADTTIRVGETVRYRTLLNDSTGALVPVTPKSLSQLAGLSGGGNLMDDVFTATAPGTARISAIWDVDIRGSRGVVRKLAIVRVVE